MRDALADYYPRGPTPARPRFMPVVRLLSSGKGCDFVNFFFFLRVCLYYGKTQGDVPVPLFGC